jgi:nicotinamidase-related amidase
MRRDAVSAKSFPDVCRPEHMALIVYDMQVGIVRQIESGASITDRIARILAAARAGGFRIIFTRRMSMPPKLMGRFQYRQAMAWQEISDPD